MIKTEELWSQSVTTILFKQFPWNLLHLCHSGYVASWEPHLLDNILPDIAWFMGWLVLYKFYLFMPRNHILPEKLIFNQRRIFYAAMNQILTQEILSFHKTFFPVTRHYFSPQEIIVSFLKFISNTAYFTWVRNFLKKKILKQMNNLYSQWIYKYILVKRG